MLIKNAFSKINETIFSNRDSLKFMILSMIRSEMTITFDLSKLKNKKLVKAKEITIEAMFNRKNWIFLSNFKTFCEMKEENIALNIDAFNFEVNMFDLIVVALLFVFNKLLTYLRLNRIFV